MTCVVGMAKDGIVYMGADKQGSGSYGSICERIDNKVFIKDKFIIGFTTSYRMGQLLKYKFEPPVDTRTEIMEYMVIDFIEEIRKIFKENGYSTVSNNEETGGVFLVGYKGRLFRIDNDYQVGESSYYYDAVGSGQDIALGSICSLLSYGAKMTPQEILTTSLLSANRFNAYVGKESEILKLGYDNE